MKSESLLTEYLPDSSLRIDPDVAGLEDFPREFFRLETAHVARGLIGAWFVRRYRSKWYGARIIETEAYLE